MGLLKWIKRATEEPKQAPAPDDQAPPNKVFEGVEFPAEVDVTIQPTARNRKLQYRWHFRFGNMLREGTSTTQKGALKDASNKAWELVNARREREAHMQQKEVRI